MFGISMWELVLVGLVLFLVVGPSKLPGLAKSIGQGIRDLRKSLNEVKGTVDKDDEFVKAVKEARQSVAEAREAVRSMFDDDDESRKPPYEADRDPAPRPVPRGRALVRPAPAPARARARAGEAGAPGPLLESETTGASYAVGAGGPAGQAREPVAVAAAAFDLAAGDAAAGDAAALREAADDAAALREAALREAAVSAAAASAAPVSEADRDAPLESEVHRAGAAQSMTAGVPSDEQPRTRSGRRMVRPGRRGTSGGGSPPGSG